MTSDSTSEETVTTEAEFKSALTALVMAAHESGVAVDKPWICQTDDSLPDYEAMITELDESATAD